MKKSIVYKEEERKKNREETAFKIREVLNMKPLYKQIEEKFKNDVELPQLEMKKKALEDLRNFYKPIDPKELMIHSKKYHVERANKMDEIRKSRELSLQA